MSKTWVVPERAKPGRKKNNAGSTENDEAEVSGISNLIGLLYISTLKHTIEYDD